MSDVKQRLLNVPSIDRLQSGLRAVIKWGGVDGAGLTVVDRRINPRATTFPSEIVSCKLSNGLDVEVFCKYWVDAGNEAYGHRGGKGYEAEVYYRLLTKLESCLPNLYGIHRSKDGDDIWLVTQYLPEGEKVSKIPNSVDPEAMSLAADWLGTFHDECDCLVGKPELSFLKRYDAEYYRGWAVRTAERVVHSEELLPWLKKVYENFEKVIAVLAEAPQTVLHGEFYPHNILYQDGLIYPVDWESAAVGPGEIDFVTLTDGWSAEKTRKFKIRYELMRWPQGAPKNIVDTYFAAQVYVQMRWISEFAKKPFEKSFRWKTLHHASTGLGLL